MKENIKFYYFGALLGGFAQYPYKSIFDRHDVEGRKEEWRFVVSHQQDVCYYEYIYQNVRTKLDGGRKGGRCGIAIELKNCYITDPQEALKAMKAMFDLLLKQKTLIATSDKGEIGFVPTLLHSKKKYLDKTSTILAKYLEGEYKDYLKPIPPNIPSPNLSTDHKSSYLSYEDKPSVDKMKQYWEKQGILTILSSIPSDSQSTSNNSSATYTRDQVRKMAQDIQADAKQKGKQEIISAIQALYADKNLSPEKRDQKIAALTQASIHLPPSKSLIKKEKADNNITNIYWVQYEYFCEFIQGGKYKTINNIKNPTEFNSYISEYFWSEAKDLIKKYYSTHSDFKKFLEENILAKNWSIIKKHPQNPQNWPEILIAREKSSKPIIPISPVPNPSFFKKHKKLIFATCFIGLIACLTPVIWNCLSPENPDPQITENNDQNNTASGNQNNTASGNQNNTASGNQNNTANGNQNNTANGNQNNTASGNQNNTASGNQNKPVKVEQSPKCKNRHTLLTVGCLKGKARYYLKSKAFLKKHQGTKITSPQQFLDLLWSDIEGISIVMEVYDNDVDKMKKNVTTVLNQKSFPSIEAFISDQITEQIKKDSTKTITISTSNNTIAAMQGKANQAGKIGTQKNSGEILLYKEQ